MARTAESSLRELLFVHMVLNFQVVIWIPWKQMSMTMGTLFPRILLFDRLLGESTVWKQAICQPYFSFAVTTWQDWLLFEQLCTSWSWAWFLISGALQNYGRGRSDLRRDTLYLKPHFLFLNFYTKLLGLDRLGGRKMEETETNCSSQNIKPA